VDDDDADELEVGDEGDDEGDEGGGSFQEGIGLVDITRE